MRTQIGRLAETPVRTGVDAAVRNPVRPKWFAGRSEAQLARTVGITQFGVNHLTLEPGAVSSLRHWHEGEDEFVLVLSGELVLIDDNGEHALGAGDYVGFPAGAPNAHHLANRGAAPASFIAVGTRKVGLETIHYPDDFKSPRTVRRDARGERLAE